MNRKLFALLAFAAALSVTATASSALDKVTYAVTTTNITVGHAAQSSIPLGLGFWKDEGLDVEVIGLSGATAGIQQVASGQVDFATVGTEALMVARARGIKVKAVYTYAHKPIYQIVAPADGGITKVEDLKGKTIGVPDMTAGSVPFTRIILKASKIDPDKDVKWLSVSFGAPAANALRQKDIQAWAAWDTIIAALENNGFRFNYVAPDWANEMPGNVLITREDTIANQPDRVVKVARAIAKASQFGLANPAAAVRNHWNMYPQTKPQGGDPEKALKDALHIYDARFDLMKQEPGAKWGQNVDAKWKKMAELWIEEGQVPKDFDVSQAYTNQFIEEINTFDRAKIAELAKTTSW
jgi:NitT/TauT family transport system substrate-binding protein